MKKALVLTALTAALAAGAARASDTISLPAAQTKGGMPLMEALASRHSSRSFAPGDLSAQELSNLLWAAWGVNRSDSRRTIPTAMNRQELEVYVNRRTACGATRRPGRGSCAQPPGRCPPR